MVVSYRCFSFSGAGGNSSPNADQIPRCAGCVRHWPEVNRSILALGAGNAETTGLERLKIEESRSVLLFTGVLIDIGHFHVQAVFGAPDLKPGIVAEVGTGIRLEFDW